MSPRLYILLIAAAGLAGYSAWSGNGAWFQSSPQPAATASDAPVQIAAAQTKSATAKPVANPLGPADPDQYRAIVDRPLFAPGRKPPAPPEPPSEPVAEPEPEPVVAEPEPAQPEPAALDPNDFALIAVSQQDLATIAVIRQLSADKIFYVRKGETLEGGIEVIDVTARQVVIGKDGERAEIAMFKPQDEGETATPETPAAEVPEDAPADTPPPETEAPAAN